MIFEQEYIIFELLDVFSLEQSFTKTTNTNRNFDTLSFRCESDTLIQTKKQQIQLCDDSICFFPSNVPFTRISQKDELIVIHFKSFNYHTTNIEYFLPGNPQKYRELFNQILNIWNSKDISYKHDCASILHKIFSEFYKDNASVCKDYRIAESVLYIKKNYLQQDFSLSVAVDKSLVSEQYFRKLFKKEFGMSPKKYVVENRIKRAQALILTNHYTISEIAEMCGYSDYNYFSSEFKKITGIPPSKYYYNY